MTCWHAKVSPWLLALTVALTPCRGRANDDLGPVCEDSRPMLTGEVADCDGVLIGPKRLGPLLEARERVATCDIDLRLSRDLLRIEGERCDGRLRLLADALERANVRLAKPPRWQWETAVVGLAVGLVLGGAVVFAAGR